MGTNFSYTIRAKNFGPDPARGLAVYDALPNPLDGDGRGNKTFVSASVGLDMDGNGVAETTGLMCSPGFIGAQPNPIPPPTTYNSTVACSITPTLTASLPVNASVFVTITVTEAASAGTTNINLAQAVLTTVFGEASPTTDPDPTNEADCAGVFTTPANVGCEATLASLCPATPWACSRAIRTATGSRTRTRGRSARTRRTCAPTIPQMTPGRRTST